MCTTPSYRGQGRHQETIYKLSGVKDAKIFMLASMLRDSSLSDTPDGVHVTHTGLSHAMALAAVGLAVLAFLAPATGAGGTCTVLCFDVSGIQIDCSECPQKCTNNCNHGCTRKELSMASGSCFPCATKNTIGERTLPNPHNHHRDQWLANFYDGTRCRPVTRCERHEQEVERATMSSDRKCRACFLP